MTCIQGISRNPSEPQHLLTNSLNFSHCPKYRVQAVCPRAFSTYPCRQTVASLLITPLSRGCWMYCPPPPPSFLILASSDTACTHTDAHRVQQNRGHTYTKKLRKVRYYRKRRRVSGMRYKSDVRGQNSGFWDSCSRGAYSVCSAR